VEDLVPKSHLGDFQMRKPVGGRAKQAVSGLGWATYIIGLLLVTAALLQVLFQGFAPPVFASLCVGLLFLFAGRILAVGIGASSRGAETAGSDSHSIKLGAWQTLTSLGWIIDVVGLVVLWVGITVAITVRVSDAASLGIIGLGLLLLLVGTTAAIAGRRLARRASHLPTPVKS
jgi:hypothetical protein